MFPRVSEVKPINNYSLEIKFDNNEFKIFDISNYLDIGVFKELKDLTYFNSVFVEDGTIRWKNGQDFCPDTLYIEGKNINQNQIAV